MVLSLSVFRFDSGWRATVAPVRPAGCALLRLAVVRESTPFGFRRSGSIEDTGQNSAARSVRIGGGAGTGRGAKDL